MRCRRRGVGQRIVVLKMVVIPVYARPPRETKPICQLIRRAELPYNAVAFHSAAVFFIRQGIRIGVVIARPRPVYGVINIASRAARVLQIGKTDTSRHLHQLYHQPVFALSRAIESELTHIIHLGPDGQTLVLKLGVQTEILAILPVVGHDVVGSGVGKRQAPRQKFASGRRRDRISVGHAGFVEILDIVLLRRQRIRSIAAITIQHLPPVTYPLAFHLRSPVHLRPYVIRAARTLAVNILVVVGRIDA